MPTGKIKYYNQDKGYGFIVQDEGEDLFFHILKSPSAGEIKAGQRVKYEVTRGKKGLEAENIQLILTPFEQRKLSQGKVVVSRDTLVWTPATDVRSRTRQPEQRPSTPREPPVTRPTPSKPSPKKPSALKEVKKVSPAPKKVQLKTHSMKLKAVKFCPHCNRIIKGSYKKHLWLYHQKSEDALDRPSTLWGGHWESNRRRH